MRAYGLGVPKGVSGKEQLILRIKLIWKKGAALEKRKEYALGMPCRLLGESSSGMVPERHPSSIHFLQCQNFRYTYIPV